MFIVLFVSLQAAHAKYSRRQDVAGYTLSRQKLIATTGSHGLSIPKIYNTYMYQILGTWGFSPRPEPWLEMRKFHHETTAENKTFLPMVPNLVTTRWIKELQGQKKFDTFWSAWHVYWSWEKGHYTIYPNLPHHEGFVVNRRAAGLHGGAFDKSRDPMCLHWNDTYIDFPDQPVRIGYDGKIKKN